MSELTSNTGRANPRWRLLTTVSVAALLPLIYGAANAEARDADRPTVWIELGGQLERTSGSDSILDPAFIEKDPASPAFHPVSPLQTQRGPRYSKGFEGKITFAPHHSDWVFSAGVIYGRSNANNLLHQQTPGMSAPTSAAVHGLPTFNPLAIRNFSDTRANTSESHTILDFKAGKDVGLGMFGGSGASDISLGVRYAQFSSKKDAQLNARPEIFFASTHLGGTAGGSIPGIKYWHTYAAQMHADRSFHGIGPSLSWNGSAPIAGDTDSGQVTFDWGLDGAVLFGRQNASIDHQTTGRRFYFLKSPQYVTSYAHHPNPAVRSRTVVVPNIGATAGLSMRYYNAKFSFGYRGDFFFGAMDTGIDTRRTSDQSFHGPFATFSVGLGG